MSETFINELILEAITNIDVVIVLALMGVGFLIKHIKF